MANEHAVRLRELSLLVDMFPWRKDDVEAAADELDRLTAALVRRDEALREAITRFKILLTACYPQSRVLRMPAIQDVIEARNWLSAHAPAVGQPNHQKVETPPT